MSSVYGQTLLDDMVQHQGLPIPLVKQAAREILAVIRGGLIDDGVVNVSNFGTFRLKPVAARNGFNPQTREHIVIPAHQRVIFSPCKALRELIQPVHQPPIPIPAEQSAPRAAARTAPIASTGAVATKTIAAPIKPETESVEESSIHPDRRVTPDRRHATETPEVEVTEATPLPKQEREETASQSDGPDESIDEIRLEIGEEATTPNRSRKAFYLGAAAVIVIAAVTASLVYDSSPEQLPSAVVTTPTTTTTRPASPITTEAEPETATEVANESGTIEPAERIDNSRLYTEMADATSQLGQAPETVAPETVINESTSPETNTETLTPAQTAEGTAKSAETATSTPTSLFFSEQTHKVDSGESLWRLARSHYQDPLLWPHIYQANAAIISNPDSLRTGKTITIPSLQGAPGNLTKTDRRNIAKGYYLTYLHYRLTEHKDAFFALLEAKRYDNKVVEEHRSLLKLSKVEEIMLGQQETMPF